MDMWHEMVESGDTRRLDEILAEDCVFISPVVHTPQVGKDLTKLYLSGASNVLGGSNFRYVKKVVSGQHAVLEFVTEVDGIVVNGVDILTFDDDGLICEFKVMVRPLKAINMLHGKMKAMLEMLAAQPA